MRTNPVIQKFALDVASWAADEDFGVFPEGARDKRAFIATSDLGQPGIVLGKRYLFKKSDKRYPDQYWGEVVAYRVGCLLGLDVPTAFAAWDSSTGECGALVEWFYLDGVQSFVHFGEYIQRTRPDFERRLGKTHNIEENATLLGYWVFLGRLEVDWRQWWSDTLLFDALIGNTDRHQDNWGLLRDLQPDYRGKNLLTLSPRFDNGTSLGCERFPEHVKGWTPEQLDAYLAKGRHHVRWAIGDPDASKGHFTMVKRALDDWPQTRQLAQDRLDISVEDLASTIADLPALDLPLRLSPERMEFMLRLLCRRLELLRCVVHGTLT